MSNEEAPAAQSPGPSAPNKYSILFKLLASGYIAWLVALAVLVLVRGPDSSGAVFLMLGSTWLPAAAIATLVVVIVGAVTARGDKAAGKAVLAGILAFAIPILFTAIFAAILAAMNPVGAQDFGLMFGVLLLVFYLAGLVICHLLRRRSLNEPIIGFVATPLFGVVLVGLYMTVETVTSDDFIYRNAFVFEVRDTDFVNDRLVVNGVLTLNRAGDYLYEARAMTLLADPVDELISGDVRWKEGARPREPGTYHVVIEWAGVPQRALELIDSEDYFDSEFSFVILRESEEGQPPVVLRHLPLRVDPGTEG